MLVGVGSVRRAELECSHFEFGGRFRCVGFWNDSKSAPRRVGLRRRMANCRTLSTHFRHFDRPTDGVAALLLFMHPIWLRLLRCDEPRRYLSGPQLARWAALVRPMNEAFGCFAL